ncbi:MAG: hypothetical protein P1V35_00755 [Planctomycetota bacterium]|nr:hypothetical protein [Planctomycetota bacterium]
MTSAQTPSNPPVTMGRIFRLWSPLALSWLCMAIELPLITAVIGRMVDFKVQMAAVSSIAFPLALLIEGPVVMLLSASTALCRDRQSFLQVKRYAMFLGVTLSGLHAVVCLPMFYNTVALDWIGAQPEVATAAYPAMLALIPWTMAIAYRRFQQGILIRAERGKGVTQGTLVRLSADCLVLVICYAMDVSGALTAGLALSAGVTAEAIYIGWVVQPCIRALDDTEGTGRDPLRLSGFVRFYTPLALTPIIGFLAMPLGSAAMNRMPHSLDSLAVWQALHGIVFIPRSMALAYNEVVIRLCEIPGSVPRLMRFTRLLALANTGLLAIFALGPWGQELFRVLFEMPPILTALAAGGLLLSLPQPGLLASQSLHLGLLVGAGRTRSVTMSMGLFLVVAAICLHFSIEHTGQISSRLVGHHGLLYVAGSFSLATVAQVLFLAWRSKPLRRA